MHILTYISFVLIYICSFITSTSNDDEYIFSSELTHSAGLIIYSDDSYSSHRGEFSLNHNITCLNTYGYSKKSSRLENITDNIMLDPVAFIRKYQRSINQQQEDNRVNISLYFGLCSNELSRFVGIGHTFENQNFSLISQLYNRGLIKQKQFAFEVYTHGTREDFIHFGGIPSNILKYRKNKNILQSVQGEIAWTFEINGIRTSNKIKPLKKRVYFDLDEDNFIVDREVYEWLVNDVFFELIVDGFCREKRSVSKQGVISAYIHCAKTAGTINAPNIYLTHNNEQIPLLYNDYDNGNFHRIHFEYLSSYDGTNSIMLPSMFFANRVIMFNYDTHLITIHTSDIKQKTQMNSLPNTLIVPNESKYTSPTTRSELINALLAITSVILCCFVFCIIMCKNNWSDFIFE